MIATAATALPGERGELVALGLGANLGPAASTLREAVAELARWLEPLRVSPLYRTEPISAIPQPDYLNLVVVGETRLSPAALLAETTRLEARAGRLRAVAEAPRTLDLDLLLFGDRVVAGAELCLPHPRLAGRRFVLAPLADLVPDHPVPPDGHTVAELLARLGPGGGKVERIDWPPA